MAAESQERAETHDCVAASARVRMKLKDGAILLEAFAIGHKVGDHVDVVAVSYAAEPQY